MSQEEITQWPLVNYRQRCDGCPYKDDAIIDNYKGTGLQVVHYGCAPGSNIEKNCIAAAIYRHDLT